MATQVNVSEDGPYFQIRTFSGRGSATETLYVEERPTGGILYYTRADDPTNYRVIGNSIGVGEDNVTIYFKSNADFAGEAGSAYFRYVSRSGSSVNTNYYEYFFSVAPVEDAPRAITLSNNAVDENQLGAGIGVLSTSDPDTGDYHSYTLIGDVSGKFEIFEATLKLKPGQSLDYESQSSFTIRVRSVDKSNQAIDRDLTINVIDDADESLGGPTAITLSNQSVAENAAGAIVGTLSTQDPDPSDVHSYALVADPSGKFEIVGTTLKLKAGESLDYESQAVFTVRVRSTDPASLSLDRDFTIAVVNDSSEAAVGTATADDLTGTGSDDEIHGLGGGDTILGLAGNDLIYGDADNDFLFGGNNDDTLHGGTGSDTLNGGIGIDALHGGADDDFFHVDNAADQAIEAAGQGYDTVYASIDYALGSGEEIEHLSLSGTALIGTGNALANRITGTSGNNVLDGRGGADRLEGRTGNDIYDVDNVSDSVIELADEGQDLIRASVMFELPANVEDLTLTGSADLAGAGNALANALTGNSGANWLAGVAGSDVIDGGLGADRMEGGVGDDAYYVDNVGDRANEKASEGTDLVNASISFELGANVENLTLTGSANLNGGGNALANVLTGNGGSNWLAGAAGNDTLNGGTGGDRMDGGLGDDTYHVDNTLDRVNEKASEGTDLVNASISFQLGTDVENLTLTGSGNINGGGNALINALTGNSGNNWLAGAGGNDTLNGGTGGDRMDGGIGNDTYFVDNTLDRVNEKAGEGTDLVNASISFELGANVENLTLTGSGNINGGGNALANALRGNGGNNWLAGGAGNDAIDGGLGVDRMDGGTGDDSYAVDNVGDSVNEKAGEGVDEVGSSISYELGANVEKLTLLGSAAINGGGNGLANTLVGNSGANWLAAAAGADLLDGGLGADRLDGGTGADNFRFSSALGGGNIDAVRDFVVADDTIQLDRSIFTGIAANGALAAGALRLGTAAVDADDRILYDAGTGNLWYDADGVGGAAAVQFAKLSAGLALTSADFFAVP